MNATELTVGDWVNVKTRDRQTNKDVVKAGRIVSIEPYFKHIGVAFTPEDAKRWFGFGFPPEYIEPLPLTAEILEKNIFKREEEERGFSEPYCVYVNNDFQYIIKVYPKEGMDRYSRLEIGEYDDNEYISLLINHVHELQHALRLTGINKEITI